MLFRLVKTEYDKLTHRMLSAISPTLMLIFLSFTTLCHHRRVVDTSFLRALWQEFDRQGIRLENNTISKTTRACIFNSFNFDIAQLRKARRSGCRMVHRVDGPLAVYRGMDDGTDKKIYEANKEFADATIFQSQFSLNKHRELKVDFVNPVVIPNATDPSNLSYARVACLSIQNVRSSSYLSAGRTIEQGSTSL